MKGEAAELVAERMRAIAASMSDNDDAAEIRRYADWLQRQPDDTLINDATALRTLPAALTDEMSGKA